MASRARAPTRWTMSTIAPSLSSNPCTLRRYHRIVRIGSRASSRSEATRLIRFTPTRRRPSTAFPNSTCGFRRFLHTAHSRVTNACSVTRTSTVGISITSRVRCVQPPLNGLPQSGQTSTACSTRSVGSMRRRANPWIRGFLGLRSTGGLVLDLGLLPGIPRGGPPRPANCASNRATRSCNSMFTASCSAITCCWRTTTAKSSSRLALLKSTSVRMPDVWHSPALTLYRLDV